MLEKVKEMGLVNTEEVVAAQDTKKKGLKDLVEKVDKSAEKMYSGTKVNSAISHMDQFMSPENVTSVFERLRDSFRHKDNDLDYVEESKVNISSKVLREVLNVIIFNALKTNIAFESKDKSYIIKDFINKVAKGDIVIESDGALLTITQGKDDVKTYKANYFPIKELKGGKF